jgi:hypothetical protein
MMIYADASPKMACSTYVDARIAPHQAIKYAACRFNSSFDLFAMLAWRHAASMYDGGGIDGWRKNTNNFRHGTTMGTVIVSVAPREVIMSSVSSSLDRLIFISHC